MPYAEDLLEQAEHLANRERKVPRQASLRRAVSTAYYALFHLLIHDATRNWKRAAQRPILARGFDHGQMRRACNKKKTVLSNDLKTMPAHSHAQRTIAQHLSTVVDTFVRSQQAREEADYNNAKPWTRTEVLTQIDAVAVAESWKTVRDEEIAQDFLVYLLIRDR